MALESNAKKTEHNGAKNSGHDKPAPRGDLKRASKKLRRRDDWALSEIDALTEQARRFSSLIGEARALRHEVARMRKSVIS